MTIVQMKTLAACVLLAVFLVTDRFHVADAHGRLLDPPGRSSMWRYGFAVPTNVNDNGLNCGGFGVRFKRHFYTLY